MTVKMKSAKSGLLWSALERILTQAIQLAIMLVLARRLGPEAFGLVGMVAIFLAISQVFVDSGFSSAVIRKKDRTERDYSTVFFFNFVVSLICYGCLWLLSPYISDFYGKPELINIIRTLGLVIPINALGVVQRIRLTVTLNFKILAVASFVGALISGAIAILLAYQYNQGVWALVFQTLSFAAVSTLTLNMINPWLPREQFSKESFKEFFNFGSKLLVSALIETIAANTYSIIIGKKYNAVSLGQYTQANQLASVPAITMTNILQRVTYPMLSDIQDNSRRLDEMYLVIIKLACYVVFPAMALLAMLSTPILTFLIGNAWKEASVFLSVLALGYLLYPLHAINLNLLQVKGRSDLFLKLEIIKKIVMVLILLITIQFGIFAVCIGISLTSYFSLFVNTYYTGKLSSVSFQRQLFAVLPGWAICITFVFITLVMNYFYKELSPGVFCTNALAFTLAYVLYMIKFQKEVMGRILSFLRK